MCTHREREPDRLCTLRAHSDTAFLMMTAKLRPKAWSLLRSLPLLASVRSVSLISREISSHLVPGHSKSGKVFFGTLRWSDGLIELPNGVKLHPDEVPSPQRRSAKPRRWDETVILCMSSGSLRPSASPRFGARLVALLTSPTGTFKPYVTSALRWGIKVQVYSTSTSTPNVRCSLLTGCDVVLNDEASWCVHGRSQQ